MLKRLLLTVTLALVGAVAFALFRHFHLRRAGQATVAIGKPAILYFRSDACVPCST